MTRQTERPFYILQIMDVICAASNCYDVHTQYPSIVELPDMHTVMSINAFFDTHLPKIEAPVRFMNAGTGI
jgi:hypothetical protein